MTETSTEARRLAELSGGAGASAQFAYLTVAG